MVESFSLIRLSLVDCHYCCVLNYVERSESMSNSTGWGGRCSQASQPFKFKSSSTQILMYIFFLMKKKTLLVVTPLGWASFFLIMHEIVVLGNKIGETVPISKNKNRSANCMHICIHQRVMLIVKGMHAGLAWAQLSKLSASTRMQKLALGKKWFRTCLLTRSRTWRRIWRVQLLSSGHLTCHGHKAAFVVSSGSMSQWDQPL